MKLSTFICLVVYYAIARWLPVSHSNIYGTFGGRFRRFLCRRIFLKIGGGTNIERGAWFGKGTGIELGDNSGIGINAHIHPNTKIGSNVMMGPNVRMLDSTHKFDRTDIPMIMQGVKSAAERCQVTIEDDIWIGEDVLIMSSRTIKTGSIIGARTVLTKDFPEYSIIGGNPSRLIRSRK